MIRDFFLALSLIASLTLSAQQAEVHPTDTSFIAKYAYFDFKGSFASAISKDDMNTYFLLDFSKLPSRFDRVYFMNLSFSSDEVINIDPEITKNRVCFMAGKKYNESDVIKIFEEIRRKVDFTASSWPEDKKNEWLKENDKYK